MPIKLGLIGACGRMGKVIARLAVEGDIFKLQNVIEGDNYPNISKTYQSICGIGDSSLIILNSIKDIVSNIDVIIDFSSHESTLKHLFFAAEKGIPYVIGTTGFSEQEISKIKEFSKKMPVLLSPNMSLGVNVMLSALELLTKALSDNYDIEIIEAHHNKKADAPSGTALKLYEVIKNSMNKEVNPIHGREGLVGKRTQNEIGMHAVRAGSIVGEHTVLFAGLDEEIRLTHLAQSRDTFARGALKCAEFLFNKPAGYYNMKSVLGLK